MVKDASALELRAHLALLAAPGQALAEGALAKAMGRVSKPVRLAVIASLETRGFVTVEPARRGRRIRLAPRAAIGEYRVSPRARFSGAAVNALLEALSRATPTVGGPEASSPGGPLRERILAAHARLARGPSGTVDLATLREALPVVGRGELEGILLELDREGIIALGRAVDLARLDDRLKSAALEDAFRGTLVYVSRAQDAAAEARL